MLANNDEILGNGPPVFDDAPMSPDDTNIWKPTMWTLTTTKSVTTTGAYAVTVPDAAA